MKSSKKRSNLIIKRSFEPEHNLSTLPTDLLRLMFQFTIGSMADVARLQLVSTHFGRTVAHPSLVKSITFDLHRPRDLGPLRSYWTGIRTLRLHDIEELEAFPLAGLSSLRALTVTGCSQLMSIAQLRDVLPVTELDLSFCLNLTDLNDAARLFPELQTLNLTIFGLGSDCLAPLVNVSTLKQLDLSHDSVTHLKPLSGLRLERLLLRNCVELSNTALSDLARMTSLLELDLTNCARLTDISSLSTMHALRTLDLTKCAVASISVLERLVNLQSLSLASCYRVTELCNMPNLQVLNVQFCPAARKDTSKLGQLRGLRELHLGGTCIPNLQCITTLTALKALHICASFYLTDAHVSLIVALPWLTELHVSGCINITRRGMEDLKKAIPHLQVHLQPWIQ